MGVRFGGWKRQLAAMPPIAKLLWPLFSKSNEMVLHTHLITNLTPSLMFKPAENAMQHLSWQNGMYSSK